MNILRGLLFAALLISASVAFAQCPGPGDPGYVGLGFLDINPRTPDATQTVTIRVYRIAFIAPFQLATQVQGNVISVTLTGVFTPIGVPPPGPCFTTTVGPLAPGIYTVNFYAVDSASSTPAPQLVITAPLEVSAPSAIPAISTPLLGLLIALVALIGAAYRRTFRSTIRKV